MDGIIIIYKPKGYTSHDIVYKVKKMFNKKVGHTGTLDPNATGVLPILIGNGTKLSKYLINYDKKYIATIQLGIRTDTADIEGEIIDTKEIDKKILNQENINNILKLFLGKQTQIPPIYSAIKIKGKKLYEYARRGETVEIPEREINIYDINLLKIDKQQNQIEIEISCSKGTYIRSLCEDISKKLGTIGYLKELTRIKVGEFEINNSVTIEKLEQYKKDNNHLKNCIITLEEFFGKNRSIELNESDLEKFLNGVKLNYNLEDGIYKIYNNYNFIGIGIINNKKMKRDIVI